MHLHFVYAGFEAAWLDRSNNFFHICSKIFGAQLFRLNSYVELRVCSHYQDRDASHA